MIDACTCDPYYCSCKTSPPIQFYDAAMRLARRGATAHEIAHVMMTWATIAAESAIDWAAREDEREAREAAEDEARGTTHSE